MKTTRLILQESPFWNVSVFEIQKFCEENGFCVWIENGNYWLEKEYGR